MKILYDGKEIGNIVTNRSLSIPEALNLIGIDPNEEEGGDPKYDYSLFELDYTSEYASAMGRKGGSVKSERKAITSRENGKKGGRPKKEPGKVSKIRYGKAEVLEQCTTGIRLIKFNGRFYTTYGRMFAVAGNHVNTPYNEVCEMKRYDFCDWNELRDMYSSE